MVKIELIINDYKKISEFENIVFKYGKKLYSPSADLDSQRSDTTNTYYDVIYFSMEIVSKDKINDLIGELDKIDSDYSLKNCDSGELIKSTTFY